MIKKIFTFGDGYASNHIWPEWPWLIECLFPTIEFEHYGAIGAGNEFIADEAIRAYKQNSQAFFLVQWTMSKRFDKLLQDDSWNEKIQTDPVYFFNKVQRGDKTWWLSSGSTQSDVVIYHRRYLQSQQHDLRSKNWIYLLHKLLENKSVFFSTYNINAIIEDLCLDNFISQNMSDFSDEARFSSVRQKEVQPSPCVHLEYVKEFILPLMPIEADKKLVEKLTCLINDQSWIPYNPDRMEIWENIKLKMRTMTWKDQARMR